MNSPLRRAVCRLAERQRGTGNVMRTGDVAAAVGKGLLAGLVGTVAMTLSSTAEAKLRGRGSSSAPADAAAKVLGVEPKGDRENVSPPSCTGATGRVGERFVACWAQWA